jgi:four helix bundle protein
MRDCVTPNADCGLTPHSQFRISRWNMQNELELRTKRFALAVIELIGRLPKSKTTDVLGYHLLKSGTSIGANYRETVRAQSRDDFIHKISICEKEAAETKYWLELLLESNVAPSASCSPLLIEIRELLAIFVASRKTAKSRR